ncbi:MAG: hypothetical protein JO048_09350 [Methylobacteriaceae bacterium]|nr:hypothetical protein [Methylobacteriaceae bacterium]
MAHSTQGSALADDARAAGDKLAPQVSAAAQKAKTVKDEAGDLVGIAGDIASTAVEQGRNLLQNAKGHATGFADQRKDDAAQSIADVARSLRESGTGFDDRPNIAAFVGSAADGLDLLANGIRERSFAEIYAEAETFARERPVAVGIGAALAGFFLARFIKSSADELAATHHEQISARANAARSGINAPTHRV